MPPLFPLLLLLLLLLPLFSSSSFHGTSLPLYQAGFHHFSTASNLSSSSSSSSNSSFWLSPSGNFTFGFKTLGSEQFLLCIWVTADANRTPLWWPNITNPILAQGATLSFTGDGTLLLSDATQTRVWSSLTTSYASFARLADTGNLQLLDVTKQVRLWQSFRDLRDALVLRPRDEDPGNLLSGSFLKSRSPLLQSRSNDGESSYSSGRYYLQTDGYQNVYVHAFDGGSGVDYIYMYAHVNVTQDWFELSRDHGRIYRDNSSSPMSVLRLDPDGELRVYYWDSLRSAWSAVWQFIDNKCLIGSPCGAFGICSLDAYGSPSCACPVGYEPVSSRSPSLGCRNGFNFSSLCDAAAAGVTGNGSSSMLRIDQNPGSDYNYNDISSNVVADADECGRQCLGDCRCVAASFRLPDRTCFFKGRDGGIDLLFNGVANANNTLLIKLPRDDSGSDRDGAASRKKIIVVVVVVGAALLLLATIVAGVMLWRSKQGCCGYGARAVTWLWWWRSRRSSHYETMDDGGPIRFTYRQLVDATANFGELLGQGGFGRVYKGRIVVVEKGKQQQKKEVAVAVKVLKSSSTAGAGGAEAEKQLRVEVETLGKIHHVNLVDLVGYCIEGDEKRILVYEYVENGSLAEHLSAAAGKGNELSWAARYSIALGTARGIAYLHHGCNPQIVHCDIKPQNVLLDRGFTPKVADFGFARRLEELKNHRSMSGVRGTRGYIAPEWLKTPAITPKADVFSYGVLLLELVRGFGDRRHDDYEPLVDWAYKFVSSAAERDGDGDEVEEVREQARLASAGLWCVQQQPDARPSMLRVLQLVDGSGADDDDGIQAPPPPPPPPPQLLPPKVLLVLGEEDESSCNTSAEAQSFMPDSYSHISAR